MNEPLCGVSAFRFHRIPPHVLSCLPEYLPLGSYERHGFASNSLMQGLLGSKISLALSNPSSRYANKRISWELYSCELPSGSIIETGLGFDVFSPCATCLSLARTLPLPLLVLAIYEICGFYSEWKAPNSLLPLLDARACSLPFPDVPGSWRCVRDGRGASTGLWQRAPILSLDELRDYIGKAAGVRGVVKLRKAIDLMRGATASPFESKAATLLTFPRRLGGQGFTGFECNHPVTLSNDASILACQRRCYIDLYNESSETLPPIAIECQGRIVHDDSYSGIRDADRTLGIERMGIEVLPVTYKQINDPRSFEAFCSLVADKIGQPLVAKEARLKRAETELRYSVLKEFDSILGAVPEM